MLPELHLFGFSLHTYGVMVSLAHVAGILAVLYLVRAGGRNPEPYVDLMFALLLSGLIGARAGYVLEHMAEFERPVEWLYLWKGGLSLFSGLLLAIPAFLAVMRWHRLPLWETADRFIPVLPFSLGILRIGCFAAGCCHGVPTQMPWGIVPISPLTPFHLAGEPLHPTQLYEALFLFASAALLLRWRSWRLPTGATTCSFLAAYGAYRLLTNPLRGDLETLAALPFSAAQLAAAALFSVSTLLLVWRLKRASSP